MSWSRYEPPRNARLPDEPVDLFERAAANGPHPWTFGKPAIDPAATLAAELAALREQARAEGLAAGLADARAIAQAEVESVRARWTAGVEALVRQTLEVADERRRELCELAIGVAEAVLQTEVDRGRAIEPLVAAGLGALARAEDTVLVLASVDAERSGARLAERWPRLTVRVDAELPVGSVRLESVAGTVDLALADRIARARALVLGGEDP